VSPGPAAPGPPLHGHRLQGPGDPKRQNLTKHELFLRPGIPDTDSRAFFFPHSSPGFLHNLGSEAARNAA
jgi:hypothetical protein